METRILNLFNHFFPVFKLVFNIPWSWERRKIHEGRDQIFRKLVYT